MPEKHLCNLYLSDRLNIKDKSLHPLHYIHSRYRLPHIAQTLYYRQLADTFYSYFELTKKAR